MAALFPSARGPPPGPACRLPPTRFVSCRRACREYFKAYGGKNPAPGPGAGLGRQFFPETLRVARPGLVEREMVSLGAVGLYGVGGGNAREPADDVQWPAGKETFDESAAVGVARPGRVQDLFHGRHRYIEAPFARADTGTFFAQSDR